MSSQAAARGGRPYVAAVLLGTALSAFAPGEAVAAAPSEATLRAISDLGRYCTACWRNAHLPVDTWTDCTQEVFRRLIERVPTSAWEALLADENEDRREFLRAIDAVKKRQQRARKWSPHLDGVADRREQRERGLTDQREAVRQAAETLLTARQQRIVQMSLEGWSVHDMAAELRLPAERISDEKYKAVQRLRQHLAQAPEGHHGAAISRFSA